MDTIRLCIVFMGIAYVNGHTEMIEPANPSVPLFVPVGGSFTLGCRNTLAKPVEWLMDDEPISGYGSRRVIISQWVDSAFGRRVTVSSLRVPEAIRHDQARYGCRAEGERVREVQVFVLALGTRDAQLSQRSWERGNNEATLYCNPEQGSFFDATLTWYKNGEVIAPEPTDTTTMLLDKNRTLFFRDLTYPRDAGKIGKYECVLRLTGQGRTFAQNAYVKAAAIIDSMYAEEEGEHVTIHCAGHSYPRPAVTWRRSGHTLEMTDPKYRVDVTEEPNGGFVATLTVKNFASENFGNYSCLVDSFATDYEMDDMRTLVVDDVYYAEIQTAHVSEAGMVIGILIAVVACIYIVIVIVVVVLICRRKRREKKKGEKLADEEESPMLRVPAHGRPRRDTMSDTGSHGEVPINTLLLHSPPPPGVSDDDNESRGTQSSNDRSNRSNRSDDSIHKEKIPTSDEGEGEDGGEGRSSSSGSNPSPVFIVRPDSPRSEGSNEDNTVVGGGRDGRDGVDGLRQSPPLPQSPQSPQSPQYTSPPPPKPARHSLPRNERPPSLEDILAAERDSHYDPSNDLIPPSYDDQQPPPPLPPKAKSQDEYLDMTGSLGRGSRTFPMAARNRNGQNGSRKLGDSPLRSDEDSSVDGDSQDSQVETEVVIEPKPKEEQRRKSFDTAV